MGEAQDQSAFTAGHYAYRVGLQAGDNPFLLTHGPKFDQWMDGWNAARMESNAKPMNDDEALQHLESLMQDDNEADHITADRVLCDLLTSLGYEKTVAFFRELDKWYA